MHLALLGEDAWDHLVEEADQPEEGVVWQVLQRKLPLRAQQIQV